MPGVLMIESLTQVATLLLLAGGGDPAGRAWLRGVEQREVPPSGRARRSAASCEVTLGRRRGRIARAAGGRDRGRRRSSRRPISSWPSRRARRHRRPRAASCTRPRSCIPARAWARARSIGPYATIGPNVTIGRHCRVGASTVIDGTTEIGDDTEIYPFASIGLAPQDLKFKGEPTRLVIGHHNVFREFVTIHRGHGRRRRPHERSAINNLFMAYAHVAHDCHVGSHTIFGNGATLGGHVTVEDYADDQRVLRRASVLPRRAARVHRRLHGRHARRAAVREDGRQPRAHLRRELDRAGAARVQLRAHRQAAARLPPSAAAQHEPRARAHRARPDAAGAGGHAIS